MDGGVDTSKPARWINTIAVYEDKPRPFFYYWLPSWVRLIPLRMRHARTHGIRAFFGNPFEVRNYLPPSR